MTRPPSSWEDPDGVSGPAPHRGPWGETIKGSSTQPHHREELPGSGGWPPSAGGALLGGAAKRGSPPTAIPAAPAAPRRRRSRRERVMGRPGQGGGVVPGGKARPGYRKVGRSAGRHGNRIVPLPPLPRSGSPLPSRPPPGIPEAEGGHSDPRQDQEPPGHRDQIRGLPDPGRPQARRVAPHRFPRRGQVGRCGRGDSGGHSSTPV